MSLPSTGLFTAVLFGMELAFDGETWTGRDPEFSQFAGPALARETRRQSRTHRTVDVVGRAVLDRVFPGKWTEGSARVDAWEETLDPGAVD